MQDFTTILIAMLAVFGFYSALAELRAFLRRITQGRNVCARKSSKPFDKEG